MNGWAVAVRHVLQRAPTGALSLPHLVRELAAEGVAAQGREEWILHSVAQHPEAFRILRSRVGPWAQEAGATLSTVLGRDPLDELALYTCDATRLGGAGVPTVIFGPGDIAVAHTTRERLSIEQLLESVVGYMALVL